MKKTWVKTGLSAVIVLSSLFLLQRLLTPK